MTGALALAGPAWERQSVPVTRDGDAMVIALDLSRSMEATDLAPSRLARARLKLKDILRERAGGETALVVFSANAFVVTPLTDDTDTIDALVPTLSSSLMPSRGSYPEAGLEKARQLLEQAGVESGRILLITDGGNLPPALTAARTIRDAGHSVSVLAVGTEEGGPIPDEDTGFVTDGRGNIALPKVPVAGLRRIARAGAGEFAVLSVDGSDLRALSLAARRGGLAREEDSTQSIERWLDRGPWLAVLLLPLIAFAFRRNGYVLAGCLVAALVAPQGAQASAWEALWKNRDQRGAEALEAGKAYEAAELFTDPAWQASAAYRAGDFEDSAERFGSLEGDTAAYNRATAQARAGDIEGAIAGYELLLEVSPDHEDAQHNLDVLRALQGNQDQQGAQGGGEGESGEGDPSGEGSEQEGSGSSQGGQSDDPSAGQQQQSQDSQARGGEDEAAEREAIEAIQQALREAQAREQGEPGEQAMPMTAEERDAAEQQQALEQWLRRIPDDPGGLLRRKFRYQYQRRQTDQDGNRLWPDDRTEPW